MVAELVGHAFEADVGAGGKRTKTEVLDQQVTIGTIEERGPLGGAEVVFRGVGRDAALVEAVRLGIRALAGDAARSADSDLNVGPIQRPEAARTGLEVLIVGRAGEVCSTHCALIGACVVGVLVGEDLIVEELIPENGQLAAGVGNVVQIVLEAHQVVVGKFLVELRETVGAPAVTSLEVLGEELEQVVRGLTVRHDVDDLDAVAVRLAVALQLVEVLEERDEVDNSSVHVLHAALLVEHRVNAERVGLVLQRAGGIFGIAHRGQGGVGFRSLSGAEIIVEEHAVQPSSLGELGGALVLLSYAQEVEGLVPRIDLAVQNLLQGFAIYLRSHARLAGSLEPIDEEAEVLVGWLVFAPCLVIGDVVGCQYTDAVDGNEPGGGFAQREQGDRGLSEGAGVGIDGPDDLIMDGGSCLSGADIGIPRVHDERGA